MPELPEVEITARRLDAAMAGAEVESALVDHNDVAEAAVIGKVDETTGQQIVAFVTLKGNVEAADDTTDVLREHVARKIGKLARPTTIIFTPDLPKTRSGKIMRRLLKDVAEERELGDVTTLAERLDTTAIVALLNDYFEHMVTVVFEHGGTLDSTV